MMKYSRRWQPVIEEIKSLSKNVNGQDTSRKLLELVCKLEGILTITNSTERKYYPKLFTIERRGDACLQEKILNSGQNPLYCYRSYYEAVSQAVANMTSQNKEFDREELLAASCEINERVTKPAVITCIRFWMSLQEPLLIKDSSTNKYDSNTDPSEFVKEANSEWDEIADTPLRLNKPR